jgi:hypothetical protein
MSAFLTVAFGHYVFQGFTKNIALQGNYAIRGLNEALSGLFATEEGLCLFNVLSDSLSFLKLISSLTAHQLR